MDTYRENYQINYNYLQDQHWLNRPYSTFRGDDWLKYRYADYNHY